MTSPVPAQVLGKLGPHSRLEKSEELSGAAAREPDVGLPLRGDAERAAAVSELPVFGY